MSALEPDLVLRAPAKINLTLEVLGRRHDGFHELRSIVSSIDICDELHISVAPAGSVELEVSALGGLSLTALCNTEANLVVKAVRQLQQVCGVDHGVRIHLKKRIPIGAGLGGGSSDAAAALVGVNRLWGLGLSKAELSEIGLKVGCDIPAMVYGGALIMRGRGERIKPIIPAARGTGTPFWMVVANPKIICLTSEVFRQLNGGLTTHPDFYHNMLLSIRTGDVVAAARYLYNGLETVVFDHYPATRKLAERLRAAGALGVLLSGSGASVFALVRDKTHGNEVVKRLGGGYLSIVTTTLPDGVMVAHGPLEP